MAEPVLAREYVHAINTGTEATPVWTTIKGLKEWSASSDRVNADTTDFESAGVDEHLVARRSHSITLTGQRESGDAGQDAVQAVALSIGSAAVKQYRITAPGGGTKTFKATANVSWAGTSGGAMDDPAGWEVELAVSGAITSA